MNGERMKSKEEQEMQRQRIIAMHTKDPDLARAIIASRCGTSLDTIVKVLKAAGLYTPRAHNAKVQA